MSNTQAIHRPLMTGISIKTAKWEDGVLVPTSGGTLMGVAVRPRDKKKVLVTAMHCITGSIDVNPDGGKEVMCQPTVSEGNIVGTLPVWNPAHPAWGMILGGTANKLDTAYFEIEEEVLANFTVHDYPNHGNRQIVPGVYEPVSSPPVELLMVGAQAGTGPVVVTDAGTELRLGNKRFVNVVVLYAPHRPIVAGDSGSACLYPVPNMPGKYQMACLVFAIERNVGVVGTIGYAIPASVIQSELQIEFGNTPPVAEIVKPKIAPKGSTVHLNGSKSHDPDGGDLKYLWEFIGDQNELERLGLVIKDSDQAEARFTAPSKEIALPFRLTVTDDKGDSDTADVTVNVKNHKPIAYAGHNQLANLNKQVTLKGSVSDLDPADRDYVTKNHTWTQCDDNPALVTLATVAGWPARRTFTPTVAGEYFFTLIATDPQGLKAESKVKVKVLTAKNRPPKVKAGPDQEVTTGSTVHLDGSQSKLDTSGEDIVSIAGFGGFPGLPNFGLPSLLTFQWIPPKGITLSSKSSSKPHFTAPNKAATLDFTLKVTDFYKLWAYDDVTITVCTPWADTSKPHKKTVSEWKDTGQQRENQLLLIMEKEQTRTITTEKEQKRNCGDNEVKYRWVSATKTKTETRWVPVSSTPPPPTTPTPPPPPPQVAPPKPTSGQWDVRHSNGKIQFKVTSLPTVTPAVSQARALLEAGQPPNLTTLTKPIGITLNQWITALSSGDAKWRTGSWAAHIRFENSVGNSPYSTGKAVAVPTPPPPAPKPPPTPPPTDPVEIWGPWKNVRIVWTSYSNWVNTSQTRGSLANRERKQTRQVNRQQIQRSTSNLGNTKTRAINIAPLTQERWVSDPEPEVWGPWTDTGRTREHPVELIIEKEQKRTSNYGNTQTRWVVA